MVNDEYFIGTWNTECIMQLMHHVHSAVHTRSYQYTDSLLYGWMVGYLLLLGNLQIALRQSLQYRRL